MSGFFVDLAAEQAWRDRAACHPSRRPDGVELHDWVALFFPGRGNKVSPALEVCAGCPVRAECLTAAEEGEPHESEGIWGGMTGRQRRGSVGDRGKGFRYPPAVRAEAVRLRDSGLPVTEVARLLDVHRRTVHNWLRAKAAA